MLKKVGLILFLLISFAFSEGYVSDGASILSAQDKATLENFLYEYQTKTTHQIAVVTIKSLDGYSIEDKAVDIFKKLGIGQKGKDDGILFLIALNDKKMRIEVGYGLEGVLNDGKAGELLDTYVIPNFKTGAISEGIVQGTAAIAYTIAGAENIQLTGSQPPRHTQANQARASIAGIVFWIIMILLFTKLGRGGKGGFWSTLFLLSLLGGGRNSYGSRGGGFGGGFGGFGGGFSGGGGASRGW